MGCTDGPDTARLQQALADQLVAAGTIISPSVGAAFRAIPRHVFLPGVPVAEVYRDTAVTTKWSDGRAVSSSSQPSIMAQMLEQVALRPGHTVLEVGAGTGYNAALMGYLVGETGHVITIDIDEDIVVGARRNLAAAGVTNVTVLLGDGALGWASRAPYDRIILTVGTWDIMPAWREQLKGTGRLVAPLWLRGGQKSIAWERAGAYLQSCSLYDCGFMLLRGAYAGPTAPLAIESHPQLALTVNDGATVDAAVLARLLEEQPVLRSTGRTLRADELAGATFWLEMHEPSLGRFWQTAAGAQQRPFPALEGSAEWGHATVGILAADSLCLLTAAPDSPPPVRQASGESTSVPLVIQAFGDADKVVERLLAHLHAWDADGRPGFDQVDVRSYAVTDPGLPSPVAGEIWLNKPLNRLRVTWHA